MSIALDSTNRRIGDVVEPSGFKRGSVFEPNACSASNSASSSPSPSSSESSSIGKNSDLSERLSSDGEDCEEENEAQSSYKGPLEMMEALEEVLPVRRGISKFYNGKSKSFTSLGDAASTSSIKDITKPENAYTRKRRNLMAFNQVWDSKNRSFGGFPLRSNGGGISKRPFSSSRSTLALAVAMSSSESSSSTSDESCSRSPPPLPPLHPQARVSHNGKTTPSSPPLRIFCASRSLSLADLQQ